MFREVGFTDARLMEVPTGLPADLRRDRGPGGLADRHALRPLRRAARAAGAGLDERPVDSDPQGRRPDLRPRRRRRQGRAGRPPGHAARLRRQAAVHRQAHPGGDGGDREQPRGVRRGAPRALRVRPVRHLRHGQPEGRRARAHHRPARRRRLHRHRAHPRAPPALRRLRRPRPRRHDGDGPAAGDAARRRRQRRRRRASDQRWAGADLSEEDFRASADLLDGVELDRHRHRSATGSGPARRSTPSAST